MSKGYLWAQEQKLHWAYLETSCLCARSACRALCWLTPREPGCLSQGFASGNGAFCALLLLKERILLTGADSDLWCVSGSNWASGWHQGLGQISLSPVLPAPSQLQPGQLPWVPAVPIPSGVPGKLLLICKAELEPKASLPILSFSSLATDWGDKT